MRKHQWKAVAVAAVLMVTVPALMALAAEKSGKPAPMDEKTGVAMPAGCGMHGGESTGMGAGTPGCGTKADKGGCCMHGAAMKNCGMKADKGGCCMQGAAMKNCGTKADKGGCCVQGAAMKNCGTKADKGGCCMHGAAMKNCGMKGGMGRCCMQGAAMKNCGMKAGKGGCCMQGAAMKNCGMKGGMGKGEGCAPGPGMKGCGMKGEMGPVMGGGMRCGPGMRGGPMHPGMGPGPMMMRGLDLTPEQHKRMAEVQERQARLAIEAEADTRLAALDLHKLMRAATPDRTKIDAQIEKLAQLRAQLQKSRAATLLEVRALLTPEQLKKWQAGPMEDEEEAD